MPEQVFVSPWGTGSFAAIACTGVSCVRPPKGISTVPAPLEESNRSDSPFLLQVFRSLISAVSFSSSVPSGTLQGATRRAGTRTSIIIGLVVALSDLIFGVIIGMAWGYVRSLDKALTEIYNVISNIPQTLILILVSYILRPSMTTIIISMCMVGWMAMARFIRNQVVIFRDRDYNLASRCLGSSTLRIIIKNLLPQMVSVIMLQTSLAIPGAIGDEVFLTYIGLGIPTSQASLGNLVEAGRVLMMDSTLRYQLVFPAAVVAFITIAFYIIGNAFSDAADPKNHV